MTLPKLSIIIPNYNHAEYFPKAVGAIMAQSIRPFEIIIIDDGSTDNSVEVLENLAKQFPGITYYRNERNQGVAATLNRGIDLARGDYVFLMAADDQVQPGFLEKSLQLLAKYPQAGLSCTISEWREQATGLSWHMGVGMASVPCYLSPTQMLGLEKKGRMFISSNSVIMKRSALIEAGKCIPELKSTLDWFLIYVIGFRYGICHVPESLALLNILPNSYFQRTRRNKQAYCQTLDDLAGRLNQPACRDVVVLIREGGSLFIFGIPMLRVLRRRPDYRWLITPLLLRKSIWHGAKVSLKSVIPTRAANLLSRIAGYRA